MGSILTQQYAELVEKIRGTIATDQARHYAPGLVEKSWRPTESEIEGIRQSPGRPGLQQVRGLSAWKLPPPAAHEVLEEAWGIWRDGAQAGMEIAWQAIVGQGDTVADRRDPMATRMRQTPGRAAAEWITEYTRAVEEKWQRQQTAAANDYPGLFAVTKEKIRAVVSELLGQVTKEREAEARRLAVEAQRPKAVEKPAVQSPSVTPRAQSSSSPAEGEKTQATTGAAAGTGPGTGQGGSGQGGSGGGGEGKGPGLGKGPGGSGEKVDPRIVVLALQNKIVDRLEPEISKDIRRRAEEGAKPDLRSWKEQFIQRATVEWQEHELSKQFPELLPSVVQRIEGILVRLFLRLYPDLEYLTFQRQLKLVDENWVGAKGKGESFQEAPERPRGDSRAVYVPP